MKELTAAYTGSERVNGNIYIYIQAAKGLTVAYIYIGSERVNAYRRVLAHWFVGFDPRHCLY